MEVAGWVDVNEGFDVSVVELGVWVSRGSVATAGTAVVPQCGDSCGAITTTLFC